jgi:hypothetical protein
MQDEAEKPNTETQSIEPTPTEILLVGASWALLVVALLAGFRIWSGGSN